LEIETTDPLPILTSPVLSFTGRGFCFTSGILPSDSREAWVPGFGFCPGVLALACAPVLEAPRRKRIPRPAPAPTSARGPLRESHAGGDEKDSGDRERPNHARSPCGGSHIKGQIIPSSRLALSQRTIEPSQFNRI